MITRRRQVLGTILVMTGTFVSAMDTSVVGTAMPTIIGELGGIDRYAWVFSAYLLASTVATPIFGRLADMYGRKSVYFGALVGFVAFSMLAGTSTGINELIVLRGLQGLAAGALIPTGFTIVGDLYDRATRAKISGLFSTVWVGAAILGPVIGGFLTQVLSWRWTFYVNLPIGLVALALLLFGYRDTGEHHRQRIDWRGAIAFTTGVTSLMLGLNDLAPIVTVPVAVALIVLFLRLESRTDVPFLDLRLMRDPLIGAALGMTLAAGALQFGATSFIPPFVQGVQGGQPAEAGLVLGALSIGWTLGSTSIGWVLLRIGVRRVVVAGSVVLVASGVGLALVTASSSIPLVAALSAVIGLGMGLTGTPILVTVQTSVGYAQRATVTSLVQFARSLGGAAGVAGLGSLLTASLGASAGRSAVLLDPVARQDLDPSALQPIRALLASGLHAVFVAMVVVAVAGTLLARRLPNEMPEEASPFGAPTAAD
ncbi:MAG: MFS transporter [Chloroflexota bacterium]|nr:MFS transporter [Chloroflexota bacterium]